MIRPTTASIDRLVTQNKLLVKKGIYRSTEEALAEKQLSKMAKLLREYDAENFFLNTKIKHLLHENHELKTRKDVRGHHHIRVDAALENPEVAMMQFDNSAGQELPKVQDGPERHGEPNSQETHTSSSLVRKISQNKKSGSLLELQYSVSGLDSMTTPIKLIDRDPFLDESRMTRYNNHSRMVKPEESRREERGLKSVHKIKPSQLRIQTSKSKKTISQLEHSRDQTLSREESQCNQSNTTSRKRFLSLMTTRRH